MYRFVVFIGLVLLAACSGEQPSAEHQNVPPEQAGELSVSYAWIRTAPPSSEVLGGYMTVHNGLASEIKLVSASSSRFGSVEFHQMTMNEGQMRMRQLPELAVPANSQATLSPGNKHLMMFKPISPPQKGERILVTFEIQNSSGQQEALEVWFLVRDRGPQE